MSLTLLRGALLSSLEGALNAALAKHPASLKRLEALRGNCLALEVQTLGLELFLFPHGQGLLIQSSYPGQPDTRVSATPAQLLTLLSRADQPISAGTLQISGKVELAESLSEILRGLALDWEGILADLVGDLPAHQLAQALRGGLQYASQTSRQLQLDLESYLRDELRLLPGGSEAQGQFDQIDQLRLDADRLQARIQRLQDLTAKR